MKEKLLVCASSHNFVTGGVATYYIRMFNWAQKNGYKCVLLLRSDSIIDNFCKKELDQLDVTICYFNILTAKITVDTERILSSNANSENMFITADIHCFFRLERMHNKGMFPNSKFLLYSLHPYTSRIYENKCLNYPYQKWILKKLNENVVFMDNENVVFAEEFYGIKLPNATIFHLGQIMPPINEQLNIRRMQNRKEEFCILTITRLDFPFKGYILGLIDAFAELAKTNPLIKLTLIGDGAGKDEMSKKLEQLPGDVRRRIVHVPNVSYDNLEGYFENASIYVGMGTTLLDASKYSLPCIVATAYQRDDLTTGNFVNEWDNIGGNIELSCGEELHFKDEIVKVMELNDNEYLELEKRTYNIVSAHYDIEKIMPDILKHHYVYSKQKFRALVIYDWMIILLKKIYHSFSRRNASVCLKKI